MIFVEGAFVLTVKIGSAAEISATIGSNNKRGLFLGFKLVADITRLIVRIFY
jgi:hypothetical protein